METVRLIPEITGIHRRWALCSNQLASASTLSIFKSVNWLHGSSLDFPFYCAHRRRLPSALGPLSLTSVFHIQLLCYAQINSTSGNLSWPRSASFRVRLSLPGGLRRHPQGTTPSLSRGPQRALGALPSAGRRDFVWKVSSRIPSPSFW